MMLLGIFYKCAKYTCNRQTVNECESLDSMYLHRQQKQTGAQGARHCMGWEIQLPKSSGRPT